MLFGDLTCVINQAMTLLIKERKKERKTHYEVENMNPKS